MAKLEITKGSDGQYTFRLKAGNGEVILTGERYTTKAACTGGIESVQKNAPDDERYERKDSKAGEPYFVLKAANHQIIGQSQMYTSETARENGIESVKKNAPIATVDDQSGD